MNIVQSDWCTISWTSGGQFHGPEMGDSVDEVGRLVAARRTRRSNRERKDTYEYDNTTLYNLVRFGRVLLDETIRARTEELIVSWRRTAHDRGRSRNVRTRVLDRKEVFIFTNTDFFLFSDLRRQGRELSRGTVRRETVRAISDMHIVFHFSLSLFTVTKLTKSYEIRWAIIPVMYRNYVTDVSI